MKTAGRENPNRWAIVAGNRAPGADGQNRSSSITWAAKQERLQPMRNCFFLTSLFIELTRTWDRFVGPSRNLLARYSNIPTAECFALKLRGGENPLEETAYRTPKRGLE